jgi:ATP-dependent Clp protease adapter protein ClpS
MSTCAIEKTETQSSLAKPWAVIFHNDDKTTFDCVMEILMFIIGKPQEEAYQTTLSIHKDGLAVVAETTQSIAETLRDDAIEYARRQSCPLKVTAERND